MGLGLMNLSIPGYMSYLKNDANLVYAKHYHFYAEDFSYDTPMLCDLGNEEFRTYKILISTESSNRATDPLGFNIAIKTGEESTNYGKIFVDLSNGIGVSEQEISVPANSFLILTPIDLSELDYQTQIVIPDVEFDIVLFCKPKS